MNKSTCNSSLGVIATGAEDPEIMSWMPVAILPSTDSIKEGEAEGEEETIEDEDEEGEEDINDKEGEEEEEAIDDEEGEDVDKGGSWGLKGGPELTEGTIVETKA